MALFLWGGSADNKRMEFLVRRGSRALAVVAFAVSIVLALGLLSDRAALLLSDIVYPFVAIGAGLLLAIGARYRIGRSRVAWSLFGLGVVLFGVGELSWAWYELVIVAEPPFPGLPDVFYLAAYPVLAAAVVAAPRLAANGFQRGQQVIDAVVVISGIAMLSWVILLEPMYRAGGETTFGELAVAAAYPIGDALLIAAIAIVGLRRAALLRDRASWFMVGALALTAAGDVIYLVQSWSDSYVSGSWLDSTWLVAYGLFALAASYLPHPVEERVPREGRLPIWFALIPVLVILSIAGVHIASESSSGESVTIELILAGLASLILLRLLFIIGEDRHLVEEERKQLISVVSHELRTPLTAVEGFIEVALDNWDAIGDDEKREMIEVASEQTRVLTRIVTDLVATSRDSLERTELQPGIVDIGEVVTGVVARLGLKVGRFRLEMGTTERIEADEVRLTQIVTNLLANADYYSDGGSIACVVARRDDDVEIAVHDSGLGVPARFRQSIWLPFERGVHRFDASVPGSGLGLPIVRSLAHAHGGSVGYRDSELLGGACFWVRLPVSQATPALTDEALANMLMPSPTQV